MFPSHIVARLFGYHSKEMFGIAEKERETIKVKF